MQFSSFEGEYLRQAGGVSYSSGVWGETGPGILHEQYNLWYMGTHVQDFTFYASWFGFVDISKKRVWFIIWMFYLYQTETWTRLKMQTALMRARQAGLPPLFYWWCELVFISPLNASCLRLFNNTETAHSNITLHLLWHRHIIKGWMKMFPTQEKKGGGGFTGCRNRLQCLFKTRTETFYCIIPELQTKFSSRLNNYVFQLT